MRIRLCSALLIVAGMVACQDPKSNVVTSPFQKVVAIEEAYELLPIAEITPEGWIRNQLRQNLDGFTGHLDQLVPQLTADDDIYGKDRLTKEIKTKDLGALGPAGDWQVQFLWWNSETQSNWRDGQLRTAIMLKDTIHLKKLELYIQRILSTQDADGYLGIYAPDLRYSFDNENGELWAKASLLRGLLAWYEYTQDKKVLAAVERAVKNVMENYLADRSSPFHSTQPNVGGTSHGLTITDVLESLYQITGKQDYLDYCLFLYKDFSSQKLNEDAQYAKLMNDTLRLKGHGVHTYEHLRCLAAAYRASGNPLLKAAIDAFLLKIDSTTTPSGAGIGDEWVAGRKANATTCGYEYCSLHELMHSYLSLLVKTGDLKFAEKAERIFFNAAQGARHPEKSAIAYLKSDNSYAMTGGLNGNDKDPKQTRYTYSPVHQEAAVCCVPNAGRIAPYYVQHMWLKTSDALVLALPGPCTVETTIEGNPVTVRVETVFPFKHTLRISVKAESRFALKIRKPTWANSFSVSAKYQEIDGLIVIDKTWKGVEVIDMEFNTEVVVREDINKEKYFTYGSLVLAVRLPAKEEQGKSFPLPGYFNYKYAPAESGRYQFAKGEVGTKILAATFRTHLINSMTGKEERVTLVPMGYTILRQVTFK